MSLFRLPRKTKKQLSKTIWLYTADENGNRLMAFPHSNQKDYDAFKSGEVSDIRNNKSKEERKKFNDELNSEVFITDERLESYVNDIFREDLRKKSLRILLESKNSPRAIKHYFHFINAYHKYQNGEESMGNICCLAVDFAKEKLSQN